MAKMTKWEKKSEKLTKKRKNAWEILSEKEAKDALKYADKYKEFITKAKTERESVKEIISKARRKGYTDIESASKAKAGDRFYYVNKDKSAVLVIVGKKKISEGMRVVAAHIDTPHLDLKGSPLYEDSNVALLKTHYYGGIRKYHWVNTPLALHGTVVFKNGKKKDIAIGEKPNEPVFVISDLLPHLASDQAKRKSSQTIRGEELNILCGSIAVKDEKVKEKIKLMVLDKLNKKYNMVEEDFATAEIQAVPAAPARDVGFDAGLIGAYGQDDRSSTYGTLMAALKVRAPVHTAMFVFADKEEIGSVGSTGLDSNLIERVTAKLASITKEKDTFISTRDALANSKALSSDVSSVTNPTFKDAMDPHNTNFIGGGVVLEKTSGHGGKFGGSDATAEFFGYVRALLDKNKIPWQHGEIGRVDLGGGGTVARYLAFFGMDVIDAGPGVMGMHSTYEVTSKADLFAAYRLYRVFAESK